jgi:hypothetical protein
VVHHSLSFDDLCLRLESLVPSKEYAAMLAGMDRAIADGAEDRVTDAVQRVTGRPPRSFRDLAEADLARRS